MTRNIRKSPSGNGKKIAKMEIGDAVNIIGNSKDGNWVKVKSGKAKGYVWKKSLVKGGVKVEKLADKYATTYAELKDSVDVLNLRKKKAYQHYRTFKEMTMWRTSYKRR